jgi:ABC-type multidrug transport system permease subunit
MTARSIKNSIGIIAFLLLCVLFYTNNYADKESFLKDISWDIIRVCLLLTFIHYCIMGIDAVKREKYILAVILFIVPIPFYWLYFIYYAFFTSDVKS